MVKEIEKRLDALIHEDVKLRVDLRTGGGAAARTAAASWRSVRAAPWIALRCANGLVYANLVTGDMRWFPPHRWMQCWESRVSLSGDSPFSGTRADQWLWPLELSRIRTEGGSVPSLYVLRAWLAALAGR